MAMTTGSDWSQSRALRDSQQIPQRRPVAMRACGGAFYPAPHRTAQAGPGCGGRMRRPVAMSTTCSVPE